MENEVKKSAGKVWLIPTIVAAVLLIGLVVFMVIMGKGTSALADGTVTLSEAVAPMQDGTAQLSEGVDAYTDGVDQVADGIEMLNENVPTLADGVQQLADGAVALNKGVNVGTSSLSAAIKAVNDGVNVGDQSLSVAIAGMNDGINKKGGLADGLAQVNAGVNVGDPAKGIPSLAVGMKQLYEGLSLLNENYGSIDDGIQMLNEAIVPGAQGMTAAEAALGANNPFKNVTYTFGMSDDAKTQAMVQVLSIAYTQMNGGLPADVPAIAAYVAADKSTTEAAQQANVALVTAICSNHTCDQPTAMNIISTQVQPALLITTYVCGYKEANANMTFMAQAEKVPAMAYGSTLIKNGIAGAKNGAEALNAGIQGDGTAANPGLAKAIAMLNAGVNEGEMSLSKVIAKVNVGVQGDGTAANPGLAKAIKLINAGVNGKDGLAVGVKKLQAGTAQLNEGVPTLSDGIKQLFDGSQQLKENSQALRDGASQLKDAAPALIDGIGQLVDGAKKVNGFTPIH